MYIYARKSEGLNLVLTENIFHLENIFMKWSNHLGKKTKCRNIHFCMYVPATMWGGCHMFLAFYEYFCISAFKYSCWSVIKEKFTPNKRSDSLLLLLKSSKTVVPGKLKIPAYCKHQWWGCVVTGGSYTDGEHSTVSPLVQSRCFTAETRVTMYVSYVQMKTQGKETTLNLSQTKSSQ